MQITQYANMEGVTRVGGHHGRGPVLVSRRKGHGADERQDPKNKRGFTLIEILVVISIFAFLGILVTRSIILTVGGSKKSESIVKVRENLNYSMSVIERQLRNANSIAQCPNSDPLALSYTDQYGNPAFFACSNVGGDSGVGSIASGSGTPSSVITSSNLTNSEVNVTICSFVCQQGTGTNPPVVNVNLEAIDATATGVQGADVTLNSQVSLRNY